MPPEQLDPVQFCQSQIAHLSERMRTLEATVHQKLSTVEVQLDALAKMLPSAIEEGVENVLHRAAHDTDWDRHHGKPVWEKGADHIGRRWYDRWSQFVGSWLTRLIGGAVAITALVWYVQRGGLK